MFGRGFDLFLVIILAVLIVVFLIGNGGRVLEMFNGRNYEQKKRTPEQMKKYQRMVVIFLLPLLGIELLMLFLGNTYPSLGIVAIVVAITDLVFMGTKLKNY